MALSPLQEKIVKAICVSSLKNVDDIKKHLARVKNNSHDHTHIDNFQEKICKYLNDDNNTNNLQWKTEKTFPKIKNKDSIDIYGESKSDVCIIEIDATRADQVAKKFLSRYALCILNQKNHAQNILYMALLYPDTQNGKPECEKFLRYCYDILIKTDAKNVNVVGIYIDTTKVQNANTSIELWDFNRQSRFRVSYTNNHQPVEATGMTKCAKEVVKLYLNNNPKITAFDQLTNVFNKYVARVPGKSRYSPIKDTYLGNDQVHIYTQWREYGDEYNWDDFVKLCNRKKIGITIKKIPPKYQLGRHRKQGNFVWK